MEHVGDIDIAVKDRVLVHSRDRSIDHGMGRQLYEASSNLG